MNDEQAPEGVEISDYVGPTHTERHRSAAGGKATNYPPLSAQRSSRAVTVWAVVGLICTCLAITAWLNVWTLRDVLDKLFPPSTTYQNYGRVGVMCFWLIAAGFVSGVATMLLRHRSSNPVLVARISGINVITIGAVTILMLLAIMMLAIACPGSTCLPCSIEREMMISSAKHTITYATIANHTLKLDIYPPAAANRPAPAIVYIHGGGWVQGDKRWPVTLGFSAAVKALRATGYVFVAVNYRLAPRHRWPAQIEDVKCAIRYLRATAAEYQLDPQRIGVWGDSAGGHLAAMLGTAGAEAGFDVGGYPDQSSAVQAVVDMFGPTDLSYLSVNPALRWYLRLLLGRGDEQAIRQASPLHYVTPAAPPFLIVHGERDLLVPPRQSRALHRRLRAAGVPASLVMVRHANHALIPMGRFIQPSRAELNRIITEFFARHLG